MSTHHEGSNGRLRTLVVGALGVVFGDIGTSPLYTIKEVFGGPHAVPVTPDNVYGILSLVFWALIFVVSIKYVAFIMRANNNGEGGTLALLALALRTQKPGSIGAGVVISLGLFGAAFFYGDGVITPAMTVLSAVEGLTVIAPAFETFVVPTALAILIGLFSVQRFGTARVGLAFGPVMGVWFLVLGILGISTIVQDPSVLKALNPVWGLAFLGTHKAIGFLTLGAVVLAITGAEALYADMGHFGARPIRIAWFAFALPCLVLNYFGQGALVIANPEAVKNPFYLIAPAWGLIPLVILATLAAIIASQAVISGAYSITKQAIQLGYLPRMGIRHTSEDEAGQIYIPLINWTMLVVIVLLVLEFRSSSKLAAAYGISVTATMLIDLTLACLVAWLLARWNALFVLAGFVVMFTIDFAFFAANAVKIPDGGWFPLALGATVFTLMMTWKRGRELLRERMKEHSLPLEPFVQGLIEYPPHRVEGTSIFMNSSTATVPSALLHNLKHNRVLHERVVFLTIRTVDEPYIEAKSRLGITEMGGGFWQVVARYGFMESPNVPRLLELCQAKELCFEMMETSFFLGRETIVITKLPGMALWREWLFAYMQRNAAKATDFFQIPPNRVVELGTQVEM